MAYVVTALSEAFTASLRAVERADGLFSCFKFHNYFISVNKVNWLCVSDWVNGCTKTPIMKDFKYPIYRSTSVDMNGNLSFSVSVNTETESIVVLHVVCDSEHKILSIENNIDDVFTLSQELQRIAVKLATLF